MKKDDRHHIEIAKEKYLNGKDITVCMVINSGVVYKGAFYSDCLLGNFEETAAGCIEVSEFLHIFNFLGDFVCAYRIDSCFGDKEYKKALKKVLKGIK